MAASSMKIVSEGPILMQAALPNNSEMRGIARATVSINWAVKDP